MNKTANKKSFLFNLEWVEVLMDYPAEVRYEVYDAIMRYVASGETSELKPMAKMAFSFIKKEIDYNEAQYSKVVESRRLAGQKGGLKKQNKAKQANAKFAKQPKQTEANQADNDNVNDNDIIKSFPNVKDSSEADASDAQLKDSSKSDIDFSQLERFFNSTLIKEQSSIPKIQKLTEKRKTMVRARCREYGKEAIMRVIISAAQSSFLNGGGNQGFTADFDWIFRPNNFPKILEGNYNNQKYDNRTNTNQPTNGLRAKLPPEPGCGLIEY